MKKTIVIAIAMLSVMLTGCVSFGITESEMEDYSALVGKCATLKERIRFVVEDLPQFTSADLSMWINQTSASYNATCVDITGELPEVL